MEFHISRKARDIYKFDESLFSFDGQVILANFHQARIFTQKINRKRDLIRFPEKSVSAGQINALGLIDEIFHYILKIYREERSPKVFGDLVGYLIQKFGAEIIDETLIRFIDEFPPLQVHKALITEKDYLNGQTNGVSNRDLLLEELILLNITTRNPATSPFFELFDDASLEKKSLYRKIIEEAEIYFEKQPHFGPENQNIIQMLRSPSIAVPHSLFGQLEYIRERWSGLLGNFLYRLLSSLDFIREEEKISFFGPGPIPIPVYDQQTRDIEKEQFSQDRDWMPRLVLIAKNSFVWLDQLSRKYKQSITRLDQIPDEELDLLARRGFSGLWLIGLWERSPASARIKQMCGNPEAVASAYSIAGYRIAHDLGGEESFRSLKDRAWRRGIRLASDMVPNHMGIDSDWVLYHPDYFLSSNYSPFPSYDFNGADLSPDGNIGIFIEDHYYTRTDAAVVFKRWDKNSGAVQFIYHGNDGTSMPWNDTAQLNYLKQEVREAVIQTIVQVARMFPIIRFDAAMTLAKRHYQRLWFPEPGTGGTIASRAEHALTRDQFNQSMPTEFWREVVDRIAVEAPDTLLLAEAFWLMEGYFVRTLGMHRVYNSAFMNMMRDEDNAKYRSVIKNTIEFDSEILKRYVNFMNNPDERTAVDQFGKGDKYFGICVLMMTMPGLPMFGHGQVEGFTEKYGMEFRHAYWDETPDDYLIQRHEREIFPLLHKRYLFSGVENFLLFDFFTPAGHVDENVFAFSNSYQDEKAIVIYNNRFAETSGWIRVSAGFSMRTEDNSRQVIQKDLGDGLKIQMKEGHFLIFKDQISGLEYIRSCKEIYEKGLFHSLHAYQYHVYLDFHEVMDDEWFSYQQLCEYLQGGGVPSIEESLHELLLSPVLQPFQEIFNPGYLNFLRLMSEKMISEAEKSHLTNEAGEKISRLVYGIQKYTQCECNQEKITQIMSDDLYNTVILYRLIDDIALPKSQSARVLSEIFHSTLSEDNDVWFILYAFSIIRYLGMICNPNDYLMTSLCWIDEWKLSRNIAHCYQGCGFPENKSWRFVSILKALLNEDFNIFSAKQENSVMLVATWFGDAEIQRLLGVNRYKDILWFNKESYQQLINLFLISNFISEANRSEISWSDKMERMVILIRKYRVLMEAGNQSKYQVSLLLDKLGI